MSCDGIGPGAFVLVLGPSGVGKDSLIQGARERLVSDARFHFPRRIVTRPSHGSEPHIPMTDAEFDAALRDGGLALSWAAHGLRYGVAIAADALVCGGGTVIVNGSRSILADVRRRYARSYAIYVDCPIEVRAVRLSVRGRESEAEVRNRLERTVSNFDPALADAIIDNAGPLEAGINRFVAYLLATAGHPRDTSSTDGR